MTRPPVQLARRWHFPEPDVQLLANGVKVLAFHLPGQHVAAFELVLPTPLQLEPRPLEGVATVALHALDEGTRTHPDGRISELLELQGASLHGSAGQWHTQLGGDAPAHRLPAVAALLAEVVTQPEFAPADVAHHVELQIAAFESRLASPGANARQTFRTALFGDDVREGRPSAGTPETLAAVSREAVVAWHAQRWIPRGSTLVIAGDLHGSELHDATATLNAWDTTGDPPERGAPEARPPRVVVVDMPHAVQATVHAGSLTIGRRHPDWAALRLACHAITGAFASRLNLELRERRGYTYGVHGGVAARHRDGQFTITGGFRTEVAADAVARILEELALERPFSDAEVTDAKRFLIGIAPLANETAADIARQAALLAAAGEAASFVNDHFVALEQQSTREVTAAFRRHLRPDKLTIAVSGVAAELEPALRAAGVDPVIV